MQQAPIFLVQTLLGLYITILLIRFLLQLTQADFYNPISQALVKITQPVVSPLQKLVPSIGRISLPTLIVAIVIQAILIALVFMLSGFGWPAPIHALIWSVIGLASQLLDILFYAILAGIIISWVAPKSYHPGVLLVQQITEPFMAPVRRLLPTPGGLDFSPIVVFILIKLMEMIVIYSLVRWFAKGFDRGSLEAIGVAIGITI
jgi:YggT family protein